MNRVTAGIILFTVFAVGITSGAGVAYVVFGPGLPSSIPLISSGVSVDGDINEQFSQNYSSADNKTLLRVALRNTGWALQKSLNLPVYQSELLEQLNGITFDSSINVNVPGRRGQTTNISFDLNGDYYFNGPSKTELKVNNPTLEAFSNVELKENGQRVMVLFPESNEYYKSSKNEISQYKQSLPTKPFANSQITRSIQTVDGEAMFAFDVTEKNRKGTIYVSQSPPHTIHKVIIEKSNQTSPQTVKLNYRDSTKHQFQSISIEGPASNNKQINFEFKYNGEQLDSIEGSSPGNTGNIQRLALNFKHGSSYSKGFDLNVPENPDVTFEGRWHFQDDLLSRARLNLSAPIQDKSFDASMELTNINWPRQSSSISFSAPSGFNQLNRKELQRKVMPVFTQLMMKAMSAQRSMGQ